MAITGQFQWPLAGVDASPAKYPTGVVEHSHVMMVLGPIDAAGDRQVPLAR